jgi:hypothetical protein
MSVTTTVLQTQTIAAAAPDWTQSVSFGQFDPSLGTLVDVQIGVVEDVDGTASIENLGAAAAPVLVSLPVSIDIVAPGDLWTDALTVDPTATVNLGAYDGASDFAGSSGTVVTGIAASGTTVVVDSTDLSAFIGTGAVSLTASTLGDGIEAGDANLLSELQTQAGAVVSVQYDYIASGTVTGGSGGGGGVIVTTGYAPSISFVQTFTNSATTATQTFNVASSVAGWSTSLGVAQFNPALGTLEAVDVVVNGSIVGTVAAENLGDAAIVFGTTQDAAITLNLGGTVTAQVPLSVAASMTLGAYDGTLDFAGTSGQTVTDLTDPYYPGGTVSLADSETDPAVLAAFTGSGNYDVPIASMATSLAQGGANIFSELFLDAGANVEISYVYTANVACFAAGTLIETTAGPIAVEDLSVDMQAITAGGRAAPVRWIGYRTVDCRRHERPKTVWPVRVRAGAFGRDMPSRDLVLSPDHAVFCEGVLIPVRLLVNGASVLQEATDRVSYYHVELDRHDLLLAEGLAVESFLDTGNRAAFANGGLVTHQHADFASMTWEASGCAPIVLTGAPLQAARERLAAVAATGRPLVVADQYPVRVAATV